MANFPLAIQVLCKTSNFKNFYKIISEQSGLHILDLSYLDHHNHLKNVLNEFKIGDDVTDDVTAEPL